MSFKIAVDKIERQKCQKKDKAIREKIAAKYLHQKTKKEKRDMQDINALLTKKSKQPQ